MSAAPIRDWYQHAVHAVRSLVLLPIVLYRRFISPYTPPTCRFQPSCSAYAEEAIGRFGVWRGGWLSLRRVLRCQPFGPPPGPDPVPKARGDRAHHHHRSCGHESNDS